MGIFFRKASKDKTNNKDNPKKIDNPDITTEKIDNITNNQENISNTKNNEHNSYPKQYENEQYNSNTNESFNTLKPVKISKSSLSNHKREREPSKVTNEVKEVKQEIEEERKKSDKLHEKLEILKNISEEEIDKKILRENIINLNKIELQKSIRNIMKTTVNNQKDIKEIENIYHSLNEQSKAAINKSLIKLEQDLNKETFHKTQILKKSYSKNKTIDNEHVKEISKEKSKTIPLDEKEEEEEEEEIDNSNDNNNKEDVIKKINNKPNIIGELEATNNDNYSFKCLNDNLNFTFYKGVYEGICKLNLQNNGLNPWPKNTTILSTDRTRSNINIQDIVLQPLDPGLNYTFDIKFRQMDNLAEGKYYSYLIFKINGKQFGNSILINVEIKEKNNLKKLNESVIKVFNDEFGVTDTMIFDKINKAKTFEELYKII